PVASADRGAWRNDPAERRAAPDRRHPGREFAGRDRPHCAPATIGARSCVRAGVRVRAFFAPEVGHDDDDPIVAGMAELADTQPYEHDALAHGRR
ncbi:MAG TPA: hypothetical protein VN636_12755, partial [Acidimicrobiia bacterium]|nr:hypothetical protein [Acidimicrobiia bacterium]